MGTIFRCASRVIFILRRMLVDLGHRETTLVRVAQLTLAPLILQW